MENAKTTKVMQEGVCSHLMLFAPLIRHDIGLVVGCSSLPAPIAEHGDDIPAQQAIKETKAILSD
ncbi:MAG: hypothetical protein VX591_02450 [Pseudomonadota bacterium]|nr:hypothetical protein [Pseudomonadota bacterium]